MTIEELEQQGIEEEKRIEEQEPSFLDVAGAAVRTSLTGGSTFLNMVDRKKMMPDNEGDINYFNSPDFDKVVKEMNPTITSSDLSEAKSARNEDYLRATLSNQKKWHESVDIIEKSGAAGMGLEMAVSLADIPSWVAGGMFFKAGKTAVGALNLQSAAATKIASMGTSGLAVGGAIGTSEAVIQAESNINDEERLNNTIKYGTAFGVALPLLGHTFTSIATGEGRASISNNTMSMLNNIPGTGGLRGFFSMSSADQLINNSVTTTARDVGLRATTPVSAMKDANGNFVVHDKDTAMDYLEMTQNDRISSLILHANENAKVNNTNVMEQSLVDGTEWNKFTNGVEQDVRREVGALSKDEQFKLYEEATGNKLDTEEVNIGTKKKPVIETRVKEPDDIYDVVTAYIRSRNFDNGRYVVTKHLEYIQDFYTKYGEDATQVGLKGIAGKDSRGYGHIKYNEDNILADVQGATTKFEEMLLSDELNKALLARGEITIDDVKAIASSMIEKALDRDVKHRYVDGGRGVQATSATRQRKLRMNRELYPDLFVNDIQVIGTEYADRIGGKIALKKTYGLDTNNLGSLSASMEDVYRKIVVEGRALGASERAIKKDVENTRAVFETILGSRKYNHNPDAAIQKTSRLLRKGASALYNAGFVKYAIVEPTVAIMRYGLKPVINNYVPAYKQVLDHVSNANSNDPMVKLMRQAGLASQTLRGMKYDRFDNMEVAPTTGKVEMFLDKTSSFARKYSGFNYMNDVSDFVSGSAALVELQSALSRPRALTKQESSRFARFGLSSDDIETIAKQRLEYANDGQISNWNHDNWRNQDIAKKFTRYLSRATRDTIMRADGTRVHRWQSDVNNPLAAMALQFTQMPVALSERLLLNGFDEMSARTAVGIFIGIAIMDAILTLEDKALVVSGAKDKEDDATTILTKAVTRTPIAGIVPNYIDFGLMMTGNAPLGSSYAPKTDLASQLGAGYSVGNKLFQSVQGLADGINEKDAASFMRLVPIINSFPGLSYLMKGLEKDLANQGKLESTQDVQYDKPLYNYIKE